MFVCFRVVHQKERSLFRVEPVFMEVFKRYNKVISLTDTLRENHNFEPQLRWIQIFDYFLSFEQNCIWTLFQNWCIAFQWYKLYVFRKHCLISLDHTSNIRPTSYLTNYCNINSCQLICIPLFKLSALIDIFIVLKQHCAQLN